MRKPAKKAARKDERPVPQRSAPHAAPTAVAHTSSHAPPSLPQVLSSPSFTLFATATVNRHY